LEQNHLKIRLLNGSGTINLKYLYEDVDRYGNVRIYFRRKGALKIRIASLVGSADFLKEYQDAFAGKSSTSKPPKFERARATSGSFRWLVEKYFAESEDFSSLSERTKYVRRRILDEICHELVSDDDTTVIGEMNFDMPPLAVRRLRDRKKDKPEAGNARLKALRQVFKFGVEQQYCEHNPARDVSYRRIGSQGFHKWSESEVRQFEQTHPIGTKARLALGILLYTGARRADVVEFGKQHIRLAEHISPVLREIHEGRWLQYTQQKNRNKRPVTLTLPIIPALEEILNSSPLGDLTWLVTEFGRGFTQAGFGNWFRKQCDEAGLKHCSAHGLRKAGATRAAENGASMHVLKAMFGWQTTKQAEHYTKSADQMRLAAAGMHLIGGGKN
jgi:site-specific recombinase XerD